MLMAIFCVNIIFQSMCKHFLNYSNCVSLQGGLVGLVDYPDDDEEDDEDEDKEETLPLSKKAKLESS